MEKNEIINAIISLCKKIKPVTEDIGEKYLSEDLTGGLINFTDLDMVYLVLELMEKFDVVFSKEDVIDYRFNSVEKIASIIHAKIS